jgi:hypothetical protein
MSSIYKNGNKWYYQTSLIIHGRRERIQRSLGTSDKDVATKLQRHYDYVIEYEKRNPFIKKREYLSQMVTDYLEYREKQFKRKLIAPRTYDSNRSALYNFQQYVEHRFGDIKVKRLHRKDFEDYKECGKPRDNNFLLSLDSVGGIISL